jgi:ribonuclease HI
MKLTAFIDGSCFGNPGESGYGVVLKDESGETIQSLGRYLGRGTNNIAEYNGLIGAIELAAPFNPTELHVFSDSELLVKQMNGVYKIKQPHLQKLHRQIVDKLSAAGMKFTITHVYRDKNKEADQLARQATNAKKEIRT